MKNYILILIALSLSVTVITCKQVANKNDSVKLRLEKSINKDWEFAISVDEPTNWKYIEIPHTPKIEPLIVNNQWQGTCWYKKTITVGNDNKKYFLNFGGIMHEADLWINNQWVGNHVGGYLPFNIDITGFLKFNTDNEIKLCVRNQDNNQIPPGKNLATLDFNYYGGIYRNVTLLETNLCYITDAVQANKQASGGVLVHFQEVSDVKAIGWIKVHTMNDSPNNAIFSCQLKMISSDRKFVIFNSDKCPVKAATDNEFVIPVSIDNPELWSIKDPKRYKLEVSLFADGVKMDQYCANIGIRSIKLANDGFYLNGQKTFLTGTNRHQEYPYVGYAIPENANRRDAVKIKQAGFDFVRLSHYPNDDSFLDACDSLGICVMDAIPGWQYFGDSVFIQNSFQNIRDMVRRDRNHPCVVFWENSLNESPMTEAYMVEANKILKQELPFEDTYSAGWMDHPSYDLFIPARQHAKPPFYWNNYKTGERLIFIAEYGDWEYYAQNAGFNQTEFKNLKEEERTSRQLRSAGEKRLLQQALNFQEAANSNRKGTNTVGQANWLMFDYNRGYADDIESSGICDILRIPKFAFYFYQSQRDPEDTLALSEGTGPMVKIASYWTPDSNIPVRVFSNCQEVALYLNDSLIEKRAPTIDSYSNSLKHPPFYFDISSFKAGTLKAVGFINGKELAFDEVKTPEKAESIVLEIDTKGIPLSRTETDLVFVYAKIVDRNKTTIPTSQEPITFTAVGAELIGDNPMNAEAGIATILLKVKLGQPKITIKAISGTLQGELNLNN